MTSPAWLDQKEYPFEHHFVNLDAGRLHYIDKGAGDPVVLVHGTPTWSFLYRDLIKTLSPNYRCLAPDHLGFGLSSKPEAFAYTPQAHAETFERFVESLGLDDFTLVVHDFGGPIGLAYALKHPEKIRRLVILNTWLWRNADLARGARLLNNPLGRFLYKRLNVSANFLVKAAFADKTKLTPELHRHYLAPFAKPADRVPLWRLVETVPESNPWFGELGAQLEALKDKPTLIAWGTKDKLVPLANLERWQAAFPKAQTVRFEVGHFVPEEAGEALGEEIKEFLAAT